jgi:hypothetical protein
LKSSNLIYTKENPFSLREKARMRGYKLSSILFYPLSPTLSLRERELTGQ